MAECKVSFNDGSPDINFEQVSAMDLSHEGLFCKIEHVGGYDIIPKNRIKRLKWEP
jgi:hypothetical protein